MVGSVEVYVRAIVWAESPISRKEEWGVTFVVAPDHENRQEWPVWVVGYPTDTMAEVEAKAREELHRLSSALAASGGTAAPASSEPTPEAQPDRSPGEERLRRYQENQEKGSGGGWAG